MNQPFLVGIASDFYLDAERRIEDLLAEELGSIAGLDYRTLNVPPSNIASPESLQPFDAILCLNMRIAAESLVGNDRLALVAKWGVGCENLDLDAISRAGIAVTATPQAVKRPAAESIFTLIFALAKNLVQQDRLVRGGGWRNELAKPAVELRGSVLGSIGCGNIGREMFQLAQGWGFRCLLAYDPYLSQSDVVDLGVELVDLDTLCRETDFLAINAPLTAETTGMMGVRQFRLMKRSAYLVNTSCEPIAAHPALVQALQDEWIAGAGLDVFPMQLPRRMIRS
jgi:phosphoglycerate dehydrogenase-like enzyme